MLSDKIPIPPRVLAEFCQRWKIRELAVFGSILRDDFKPESDIDVLVTFTEDADWGLFDHVHIEQELQTLFKREVDLVSRRAIERSPNWIRRKNILNTAQAIYVSR
jgi:uncharacterized protein